MSSKQKFSSKDEVYETLYDKGFVHFSDLPKEFLDADIAFEWLKGAGDSVEAYYAQIPQQWRSEDVLEFVAHEGVNVLKDISPAQTRHYLKLVMLCAVHDYKSLCDVHPQYRNDQELVRAVYNRFPLTLSKVVNEIDWFAPAM